MKRIGAVAAVVVVVAAQAAVAPVGPPPVIATAGRFGALDGRDSGNAVAVDASGAVYVAGMTRVDRTDEPGAQVFVAKFAADGALLYEYYFGGSDWDSGLGIAVNSAGEAYVCGRSVSPDFPVTVGPEGGGAFVAKVAADGSGLLFLRLVATGPASASGLTLDAAGDVYVCGTSDGGFAATEGAFQESHSGERDAFVAKLAADGSEVLWATLLGGAGRDDATAIAVDAAGSPCVVGSTESDPFPLPAGFTPRPNLGIDFVDGFLVKLSPDGSTIVHMRRIESDGADLVADVALDASGAMYLAGCSDGPDFPVTGVPLGAASAGRSSVFVMKSDPSGGTVEYALLVPGGRTYGGAIAVGGDGSVHVAGFHMTRAPDSWRRKSAIEWLAPDDGDAVFALRLEPNGSRITYATVVGSSTPENFGGMALAPDGTVVISGCTDRGEPFDRVLGGEPDSTCNVLLLRLAPRDTWLSVGRAFASDGRGVRDAVAFVGTHGFREHAGFDPRTVDVDVAVAAGENARSLRIPAGDSGWRALADGGARWTSASGASPRWNVVFGGGSGFRVRVDHAGFVAPIDDRVRLDIAVGEHRATYGRTWQRVRPRPERWLPRMK